MYIKVEINVTGNTSQIQFSTLTPPKAKSHSSLPSSQNGYSSSSSSDTSGEPSLIMLHPNVTSRKNGRFSIDPSEVSDDSPILPSGATAEFDPTDIDEPGFQPSFHSSMAGCIESERDRDRDIEGTTLYQTETEPSIHQHSDLEPRDPPLPPFNSPVAGSHIPEQAGLATLYAATPDMAPANAQCGTNNHQPLEASSSVVVPSPYPSPNLFPQHPIMPPFILRNGDPYGRTRRFAIADLGVPVAGGSRTIDKRPNSAELVFVQYCEELSQLQGILADSALEDDDVLAGRACLCKRWEGER